MCGHRNKSIKMFIQAARRKRKLQKNEAERANAEFDLMDELEREGLI